jgi:hypothetical protein
MAELQPERSILLNKLDMFRLILVKHIKHVPMIPLKDFAKAQIGLANLKTFVERAQHSLLMVENVLE